MGKSRVSTALYRLVCSAVSYTSSKAPASASAVVASCLELNAADCALDAGQDLVNCVKGCLFLLSLLID